MERNEKTRKILRVLEKEEPRIEPLPKPVVSADFELSGEDDGGNAVIGLLATKSPDDPRFAGR